MSTEAEPTVEVPIKDLESNEEIEEGSSEDDDLKKDQQPDASGRTFGEDGLWQPPMREFKGEFALMRSDNWMD